MNGHIYSNMPDTTSRISPYQRSIRRLVASALLFTSSLLMVASVGVAQDDSCGDFAAPEDAQMALDEDPSLPSSLDSDGNGVACDENPELFTQNDSAAPRDEFAQVVQETTSEDAENTTGTGEADDTADNASQSPGPGGSNQTPQTGGVALIPLAGATLTALLGGSMLLRRRG